MSRLAPDDLTEGIETPINLRNLGRVRILEALLHAPHTSRTELVRRTGLARATVGSVISELVRSGIVADGGSATDRASSGRPARTLTLQPAAAHVLGVDIGRDHVRVMLCDLTGAPVWDRALPVAADHEAEWVLASAAALVDEAWQSTGTPQSRVLGVGVGIACPIDRTGTLRADGIMPGWVGIRPADELAGRTGFAVRLVNDANAGVLAEHRYGAARQFRNVIYIRLSTGIGAGLLCDGRLLLGSSGLSGEIGHLAVDPHGLICRCGNRGCLETVASPTAVAGLLAQDPAAPLSTSDLIRAVHDGHRGAVRAVRDTGDAIGRALAQAVTLINPELVVVGGELAAAGEILLDPIRDAIGRHAMSSLASALRVVPGALGDSAGVRGAAALVLNDAPERLAAAILA